jgi:hypothetical protein
METKQPKYGKGSRDRVTNIKKYRDNYDHIFLKKGSKESLRIAAKEFCESNGEALLKASMANLENE